MNFKQLAANLRVSGRPGIESSHAHRSIANAVWLSRLNRLPFYDQLQTYWIHLCLRVTSPCFSPCSVSIKAQPRLL
jgi:hypothetical protein